VARDEGKEPANRGSLLGKIFIMAAKYLYVNKKRKMENDRIEREKNCVE